MDNSLIEQIKKIKLDEIPFPASYEPIQVLNANSIAAFGQPELENSGKVVLSIDILLKYQSFKESDKPRIVKLTNISESKLIHAGVASFDGERGKVYMPQWMMRNLEINEEDKVIIVKQVIRNHTALTKDSTITFSYSKKKYDLYVQELLPKDNVCINPLIKIEILESQQPIRISPSPGGIQHSITPTSSITTPPPPQQTLGMVNIGRKTSQSPSPNTSGQKRSQSPPQSIIVMQSLSGKNKKIDESELNDFKKQSEEVLIKDKFRQKRLQTMKTGAIQGKSPSPPPQAHSPPPEQQAYFESIPKTKHNNELTVERKQKTKGNSPPKIPWEVQEENPQISNPPRALIEPPPPPTNNTPTSSEQKNAFILFGTKSKTEEEEEEEEGTKQWFETSGSGHTLTEKNSKEKEKEQEKENEKEYEEQNKEQEKSDKFWSSFGSGHILK
ncbi:MAG: hypothetical protein EZS28_022136 [Streblomastix strix]|uniref:Ubiquitin fusion degradation protein UFD1 N-terminal subdomain 1 domain-containing protein n=1 Tax=Streblomastix strix TaxID=222440 RepID=A0A5J4VIZ3_9EUKA|nr:MAG: hypothetical protein EZS28_022136 [Streblomastix strix]